MELPHRRLGRTNLEMPILSLGGMRFQKSWDEMKISDISKKGQKKVLKRNDKAYEKFSDQYGTQQEYNSIVTGPPDYVDISYEFVLWTNYIEQMNSLVEEFISQSATYWGNSTDMKFLCTMDNISDASEGAVYSV